MTIPTHISAPTRFGLGKVFSYEGNVLPQDSSPAWTVETTEDGVIEINDGILDLHNPNGTRGSAECVIDNVVNSNKVVFEIKMKLEGYNDEYPSGICRLRLYPAPFWGDRPYFLLLKTTLKCYAPAGDDFYIDIPDTTTQFRVYKWIFDLENQLLDIHIDGVPYLENRAYHDDMAPFVLGEQLQIIGYKWGIGYTFTWHIYIDYIRVYGIGSKRVATPTRIATPTR